MCRTGRVVLTALAVSFTPTALAQTPLLTEDAKLLPADGTVGDTFGSSVSIDGNVAIVGAQNDDDDGASSGSAYVFRYNGTAWSQEAKLTAFDGAASDAFGRSVSIHGDVAVVGSPGDDDGGFGSGSAYVFRFDGTLWNMEAKLTAADAAGGDGLGTSVFCHGDVVLSGAPGDNGAAGSMYVFRFDGTTWAQEAKLTAIDAAAGDALGFSVSIYGDAAIGGARLDDDAGLNSGSAYVFRFDGTSWSQEAKLVASDGFGSDNFGISVSIDRDVAVVGSFLGDGGAFNSGAAYVFRFDGTSWTEEAKLVASDAATGDQFGLSVSNCRDIVVIGALADDDNGVNSGSAYMFQFDGTSWTEVVKLVASDGASGDRLGGAVSACENAVLASIGDDDLGSFSGSAYVFMLIDNQPPVAAFDFEQLTDIGEALVGLDASASSDPDDAFGDLEFEWTVDGDVVCSGSTCATIEVSLASGTHEVMLRVTDPAGADDEITRTISFDPAALTLLAIDKAKVMFKKDRITATGQIVLPLGVAFSDVVPFCIVGVNVAGTPVLPEAMVPLLFETHGRRLDKWSFTDRGAALGIRRFRIDWRAGRHGNTRVGRFRLEAEFGAAAFPDGIATTPRTLDLILFVGAAGYLGQTTVTAPDLTIKGNHWQKRSTRRGKAAKPPHHRRRR